MVRICPFEKCRHKNVICTHEALILVLVIIAMMLIFIYWL